MAAHPQLARDGIALRRFGQQVIERLGGKRIHPAWVVPGGVDTPLSAAARDAILAAIPDAVAATTRALDWYAGSVERWADEAARFGAFPSAFLALVGPDGEPEHYDGRLRVVDADGHRLADDLDPRPYWTYFGEAVEPWSLPQVGVLARPRLPGRRVPGRPAGPDQRRREEGTPRADEAPAAFRARLGPIPVSSFHYHHARLIDTPHCLEKLESAARARHPLPRVRAVAGINAREGVGVAEAPRGTLFHHYRVDDDGSSSG